MKLLQLISIITFIFALTIPYSNNASLSAYEQKKYKKFLEGQGLYSADDDVVVLTVHNFKTEVMNSKQAWLVEFYNSWCGFCQRFAPSWKALATDIKNWKDLVRIAAIDCSDDDNAPICRDYEIMGYPTLKYFHENYKDDPKNLGEQVQKGEDLASHRKFLIEKLIAEQNAGRATMLPNLIPFNYSDISHLFDGVSDTVQYGFLIFEEKPSSFMGSIIALDFHKTPNVLVRTAFQNNTLVGAQGIKSFPALLVIDHTNNNHVSKLIEGPNSDLKAAAVTFLSSKQITVVEETLGNKAIFTGKWLEAEVPDMASLIQARAKQALKERLKKMGDVVFQMDLETALRFSLKHEISTVKVIQGEKLKALKGFFEVLKKYFPFGIGGRLFLNDLVAAVAGQNSVNGAEIARIVEEAERKTVVFSSPQNWMACQGSSASYRGYPCGLWKLFHYLTVNSADQNTYNKKADPLEVLNVMHGYIKNFFGCADCSQHFQDMAVRRDMKNVSSLDSSIVWLWVAHNDVNKRLSGDQTEDPDHPKVQFPSSEHCPLCRNSDSTWNLVEVIKYLKHTYSSINVRYIGSDTRILHLALQDPMMAEAGSGASRNSTFFSTVDSSMCFILYLGSFLLLALLIRMFLKRGYRKKPYVHDLLGKV